MQLKSKHLDCIRIKDCPVHIVQKGNTLHARAAARTGLETIREETIDNSLSIPDNVEKFKEKLKREIKEIEILKGEK